ncbi:bifunctional homocysteine S-methyltransferase/methylenetetrahydrofolate reductase [Sporosarcina sp. P18a]|uniref:bifunctional homocysteine S-methyltransferase/methylenetetrahydrofolate reductase n=1 Tax=unclassified Sporosarcina TaxID=2647733 RepID=UPI000C16475C|nr:MULTISPECIES: bifunctional homocysteine S-methyltransferase/methylenetetrahydrofolate reductase [unclassified Sporosarcina]PIC79617.1 bifunctional homocysteine S-methyltransferase/methylenetetrahydrofolate reductase [Sporosarcina sp. P18a]PID03337.1 bifunctional homocysteine S-methyltransferase/methylenetetrahydrofolate reductase [Sporosarcina sp. P2]PID26102.1 bifunctional homocysteine S-methyltransferase/methylenetetrahydrofolate reductase [Sporosarcina sp. P7]
MSLLEKLQTNVLTADGAMGTILYSYGIDYCYEELNIEKPEIIEQIHQDYISAGADIIQTNTYSANAIKLARYGLESHVTDFNKAAIQIAKRAAAPGGQFVLGTIGGLRGIRKSDATLDEIEKVVLEQANALLTGDPDGLLLETYYDFEELSSVVTTLKKITDVPLIAQVSMHDPGVLQNGLSLNDALHQLESLGADIVGVNCRLGPYHTIQAFDNVTLPEKAFLSAYPNASLLDVEDGRIVYESEAEYFGRAAVLLRDQGVRLIGGCCGTTPKHIKAAKTQLARLTPITEKVVQPAKPIVIHEADPAKHQPLHEKAKTERTVIVELDTPRHLETEDYIKGANLLYDAGVDAITMADNSLASPRISNMAMGSIVKMQHNIRPLVHLTCRDHNLIGLQSHLMGLDALGIHDILAVTGDPTKVGDFPGATSVYDVSSMELLQLIKKLNEGISFSGKPLRKKASFSISAAFNPNVRVIDRAVQRLEKKIEAGADYFITQPVYTKEKIIDVYEATKHLDTPIFIGIMPLTNIRNAEFLHHEVPGIKLSEDVLERMRECGDDREKSTETGLEIAKELIDTAAQYFNGLYLITPFLRYDMTLELYEYIKKIDQQKERELTHAETSY